MDTQDTIASISSSVGAAARMIIRVSGIEAHPIARELAGLAELKHAGAVRCTIPPGSAAWLYAFIAPKSYTGEDLVEFHIPGNPVVARMLLDAIIARGARQAEAGEFTARAYFNGKLDLTQAEGVAATIAAHSRREIAAARQLLGGELAKRITPLMENIAQALALVEAGIDFSDEDISFVSTEEVRQRCAAAVSQLQSILDQSARFERLSHEPRVVLIGRPNAGKSTLLNALCGHDRAVVSEVAGTTRDAIWATVKLARGTVKMVDVAGVEESPPSRESAQADIARQMNEQALRELATADFVVLVKDLASTEPRLPLTTEPNLIVHTKADLADLDASPALAVSARTGRGMEQLRQRLDELIFGPSGGEGGLALNARHVRSINQSCECLVRAVEGIDAGAEVVALELRAALDALGDVLGKLSPDDLLGRIFSQFCIGK